MAPPSSLPSAAETAAFCASEYERRVAPLPAGVGEDIEELARYFRGQGELETLFIGRLVPWARFAGSPNPGHAAVADLLACQVVGAAVTTNFDVLVEAASRSLGEPDFRATVEVVDLGAVTKHGSYVKLHGCGARSRRLTIWCREQLADAPIATRIDAFVEWLAPRLRDHDLMLVGFWSDWQYLGDVLRRTLSASQPRHVFLVDPAADDQLAEKAPGLWNWATTTPHVLHRIRESGSTVLDDLRARWSRGFLRQMDHDSRDTYRGLFGREPGPAGADLAALDSETLYALRRDLTGTPCMAPVRDREPQEGDRMAAAVHRRLTELGWAYEEHAHTHGDRRLRVISGRGCVISAVRAKFLGEPPVHGLPHEIVCVGAFDDVAPANLVRAVGDSTIVRPGSPAHWTTHESLVTELRGAHA